LFLKRLFPHHKVQRTLPKSALPSF
jgi:hypothetical protein